MINNRNASLDLIKWIAIITMVFDHLRYIFPQHEYLFMSVGRIAFPLFAFCLAVNIQRMKESDFVPSFSSKIKGYMYRLGAFAVVSELPMRIIDPTSGTINIFPTLFLGLLLCILLRRLLAMPNTPNTLAVVACVVLPILLSHWLMYGFLGVLLPSMFYFTLQRTTVLRVVVLMLLSMFCTMQYYLPYLPAPQLLMHWKYFFVAFFAALSPLIGLLLLRTSISFKVRPITMWGYWFYPAQFMALALLKFGLIAL
jgi:hypothetical protein